MKNLFSFFITAAICLLHSFPCYSQSDSTQATADGNTVGKEKSIVGTWQQCSIVKDNAGNEEISIEPFIKTINADGTFRNISVHSESSNRSINQVGKWTSTNSGTFCEHTHNKGTKYNYSFYDTNRNIMITEHLDSQTSKNKVQYWLRMKELQGVQANISTQIDDSTYLTSPLTGTWQWNILVTDERGNKKLREQPVIKTINPDGTYSTMIIYSNSTNGAVSQVGRYEIIDDSTYHEKITKHINNNLDNSISIINYKFIDDEKEVMKIEYTNSKLTSKATEYWYRFMPLKENTDIQTTEEENKDDYISDNVEKMPEFPGGMIAMMKYLQRNIRYPNEARVNNKAGRAFVSFVVNKDGSIQDAEILKSSGNFHLDQEAIRVVENMPKWNPGKQSGKVVRTRFVLPVTFNLK